ncbi:short-chain dehydrogenase [Virgibacillus necropolis]|uniref:short-chain dehydrogenase n=1 Tax=Virgibacillus necropolis TaxID=163877 RepID=UPI00384AB378
MKNKKYALVIGGTGMLAQVCHALVNDYYYVSVIGRSTIRQQQLKDSSNEPDKFHGIEVDYHDDGRFRQQLQKAFQAFGTPDLVVSWIHGSAPQALDSLIDEITRINKTKTWKLFHVQSSSRFFEKENTPVPENCQYRRVYLGFILNDSTSRWLTHKEISDGVIRAIHADQTESVVGTLEPWDKRP